MEQIERIKYHEETLDETRKLLNELEVLLDRYIANGGRLAELSKYYGSPEWMEDFEADEDGKLPAELKRGVLSEDGIYDLLSDNNELVSKLAEAIIVSTRLE
ncbi:MAG: DUF4298 domain-containing protein [Erysipelotrichaceae bacterium]|nr:DUF4298 domain-containing protein [Erysipelotrichaceae bacterium]